MGAQVADGDAHRSSPVHVVTLGVVAPALVLLVLVRVVVVVLLLYIYIYIYPMN